MSQNTEDPTLEAVRLLRESGYHEAAADLATKALQRVTATPAVPSEPTSKPAAQPSAAPSLMAAPATEDERRAEGLSVLAAMKHDLRFDDDFSPKRPTPNDEAA